MTLLAPEALLGLLILPVVVLFYLFRPEPKRQQSTTYFLWKQAVPESRGETFAKRLQHNPLLWLQLFILLLLVLYLARPSTPWVSRAPEAERVVIIVDRSASMRAGGAFEQAVEKARTAIDEMMSFRGSRTPPEVMLIAVGKEPQVLLSFSRDANALKEALANLRPSDEPDELESLRPFIASLSKAHRAEVWLLGDRLPDSLRLPGLTFTSVATGPNDNVGIISFSMHQPEPEKGQDRPFLYARIENFSDSAQQRLIKLEKLDHKNPENVESVLFERTLQLKSQSGHTVLEPVPASHFEVTSESLFRLSITPYPGQKADIFRTDDEAYTVIAPFESSQLLVALTPKVTETFLLKAVAASSAVKVMALQDLQALVPPPTVDLLLSHSEAVLPKSLKVRSRFLLAPSPGEQDQTVENLELSSRDSALLADSGVEWDQLRVQITDKTALGADEVTLLQTKSHPALTLSGQAEGLPTLHWRFPLAYSSLPLSTALPVVVGRFVDTFSKKTSADTLANLTTAQMVKRPQGAKESALAPVTARASRLVAKHDIAFQALSFQAPPVIGVYRPEYTSSETGPLFAVNLFSHSESRLARHFDDFRGPSLAEVDSDPPETLVHKQYFEVVIPILLFALLLLFCEAAVFIWRGRP